MSPYLAPSYLILAACAISLVALCIGSLFMSINPGLFLTLGLFAFITGIYRGLAD